MASISERLSELGLELPPAPTPIASYVAVRTTGSVAYVSGQVPMVDGVLLHPGKLGDDVSVEQGQQAARRAGLQALAALGGALGDVDRVRGIIKVSVFVASAPGFTDQPKVANGISDLFVELMGETGAHAREAVGVAELPLGTSVEVSVIAEIAAA